MPKCNVKGCASKAEYEVIFYDVYLHGSEVGVYYQRHESCPYLCQHHLTENERGAATDKLGDERLRQYRGKVDYPYTHSGGQGFCIYRPLPRAYAEPARGGPFAR